MKRHESGMTGRPRRRVRFWSANAWKESCQLAMGEVTFEVAYIGVVVFCKYIKKPSVDCGLGVVEFGYVRMLEPIDQHLAPKDEEKRSHDLAGPFGEDGKASR